MVDVVDHQRVVRDSLPPEPAVKGRGLGNRNSVLLPELPDVRRIRARVIVDVFLGGGTALG